MICVCKRPHMTVGSGVLSLRSSLPRGEMSAAGSSRIPRPCHRPRDRLNGGIHPRHYQMASTSLTASPISTYIYTAHSSGSKG